MQRSAGKRLEILPLPSKYIFSLINFIVNNHQTRQTISSVPTITVTHGINANFTDQLPNFHIFGKKHVLCWHQNIQQLRLILYQH
jgi:hypothetical protein